MFEREVFRRRHLPHWDMPGAEFFVTGCLEGSIAARGLLDIRRFEEELEQRRRPDNITEQEWQTVCWKLLFARTDDLLDHAPAVRHLADPVLARIVRNSIHHFAGERYDLLAYVVMPSHFHWVFRPCQAWVATLGPSVVERTPRERIMHGMKLYTARECNQQLRLRGKFWQAESFDHWARTPDELERIIHYVEWNPVEAKMCARPEEFVFSSAFDRRQAGLPFGVPLPRMVS